MLQRKHLNVIALRARIRATIFYEIYQPGLQDFFLIKLQNLSLILLKTEIKFE
jgi:hypothetical protein